jgi:dimethylargininase
MQGVLTAITRSISPAMNRCELVFLDRQAIDIEQAAREHRAYEDALRELGVEVLSLRAEAELPDSVFVEDPVVVLDEVAVMTRMGAESRRAEGESLAHALAPYREIRWMREPATLEGGDVMRVGRTLYVGESVRTNAEGIRQLGAFGYEVRGVPVRGCMHLKTGCTYLGDDSLLIDGDWIDKANFPGMQFVNVVEPFSANILRVGDTILIPDAFPRTVERLQERGFTVRTVGVSELMKAEAGLTCMSVLLNA